MEASKEISYAIRNSKHERYDKRVIQEVLDQVYAGVPRKELVNRYQLGKSTLGDWLQRYGSSDYQENKRKFYSRSQKRSIVAAIDQGRMTIREAQISYGIKSDRIIREWIAASREKKSDICELTPELMSKKKTPKTSDDVDALRKELELAQLNIKALNTMIDIAEDQLKISIRKKSGAKQSGK
jgi:transposase